MTLAAAAKSRSMILYSVTYNFNKQHESGEAKSEPNAKVEVLIRIATYIRAQKRGWPKKNKTEICQATGP